MTMTTTYVLATWFFCSFLLVFAWWLIKGDKNDGNGGD